MDATTTRTTASQSPPSAKSRNAPTGMISSNHAQSFALKITTKTENAQNVIPGTFFGIRYVASQPPLWLSSLSQHCNQSRVCDHEYDHMVTDVERNPDHEDVVLVSPQYGLCPECTRAGYDQRPGGDNPPPKTPSRMPMDFEDLPREDYSKFESASKIPSSSLRPMSKVSQSHLPSNVYNPRASRVPPSNRPAHAGQAGPQDLSQAASQYAASYRPQSVAQRERDPQRPSQSQLPRESQRSSQSQITSASRRRSQRPSTNSSSPAQHTGSDIGTEGNPRIASEASHSYARTKAPPADEEGPDLEVLLNTPTVMPSSRHSELSPPGGTKFRAAPSTSSRSSASSRQPQEPSHSKKPDVASMTRSEASRRDFPASAHSKVASSSLREAPNHSQMTSASKAAALSSRPNLLTAVRESRSSRPQQSNQNDLPSYKTKASIPSAAASSREAPYNPESSSKQAQSASKQPSAVMSPAELLKRGPPKNVNASAFYDNPDGNEAKAQAAGRGQPGRPSVSCMPRINVARSDGSKR